MSVLNWVRSFEAAARHCNITLAAEELGLSQAAVSKHIQALEQRLGTALLIREARGVRATSAGLELRTGVSQGLHRIEAALDRLVQPKGSEIIVLSNASFALHWLMPRIGEFASSHPELRIILRTALWSRDTLGVDADAEVYFAPSGEKDAERLGDGTLVGVAHPRAEKRVVRVAGYGRIFDALHGEIVAEVDTFHAALELAHRLMARTVAPKLLTQDHVEGLGLRQFELGEAEPRHYWCRSRSSAGRIFSAWLKGCIAENTPKCAV
jgi:DNA-binding transcriptional LysR family regulator